MSALTSSIASRWSGVSVNGKRLLELALPVGVGSANAWPVRRRRSAYRLEQLAGELLRGAPRARLHRLPARAAELRQRRAARRRAPDVARDLRELVGGHEHAVVALVFEVQVVARHVRHRARLKAREARDAVVLVHDDVAGAQLGERAQRARRAPRRPPSRRVGPPRSARRRRSSRCSGNTASFSDGATKPSRSEAAAKRSDGSSGVRPRRRPRPASWLSARPRL